MKSKTDKIFWNSFEDELSKQAGFVKTIKKVVGKVDNWADTLAHPTILEQDMSLAFVGRSKQTAKRVDKIRALPNQTPSISAHLNPISALKGGWRNIRHMIKDPVGVQKAEFNTFKVHRSGVGPTKGKTMKRSYNPFQKGWQMGKGVKSEADRAGLQGLQDIIGAAAKPIAGSAGIGLVGTGALLQLGKKDTKGRVIGAGEAAAYQVAPAATTLAVIGASAYQVGKSMYRKRQVKNKNIFGATGNQPVDKIVKNYGT